jgi:hypothetical protein
MGGRSGIEAMTQASQKAVERQTVEMLVSVLALTPDAVEEGETPDWVLSVSGRTVGVEVTMYQSGSTVAARFGRRQVESEWEILKRAADTLRAAEPDLRDMNIGLMFRDSAPGRREHAAFLAEIAAFVRAHAHELGATDTDYWPPAFASPLMIKYLRTLCVRRDAFAEWYSSIASGWVGRPDATLAEIVATKAAKTYRHTDELWLAIQCSHRISEIVLPLDGAADFDAVPELTASLRDGPFAKAYVLAVGGIFEWARSSGWKNLTPSAAADAGPSFDE